MEKLVSVIVAVYNSEKYIEECLESIMRQTYPKFEIIVVNDGSTDHSEELILKFKNKNEERIQYIKQENSGAGQARNAGIHMAKRRLCYLC